MDSQTSHKCHSSALMELLPILSNFPYSGATSLMLGVVFGVQGPGSWLEEGQCHSSLLSHSPGTSEGGRSSAGGDPPSNTAPELQQPGRDQPQGTDPAQIPNSSQHRFSGQQLLPCRAPHGAGPWNTEPPLLQAFTHPQGSS